MVAQIPTLAWTMLSESIPTPVLHLRGRAVNAAHTVARNLTVLLLLTLLNLHRWLRHLLDRCVAGTCELILVSF